MLCVSHTFTATKFDQF
ncbi:hypothetical protein M8C21_003147 [Ambrosia artemisiifolia]|uniref:Uncharacterized protein n=1 Tax=Ambrosia artemisiifolia TaxID=4212 RepID=A0AAD5DC33_AMBAR|nr:hypothetical protein M8C21_003147 [Ambrosia artemisiifolia]